MKTNRILTFIFRVAGWFCFFIGTVSIGKVLIHLPEVFGFWVHMWICFVSSVAMTIWWYSITYKITYKSSNNKEAM